MWFFVRIGRIIVSKLKNCVDKVDFEGGKIRGGNYFLCEIDNELLFKSIFFSNKLGYL